MGEEIAFGAGRTGVWRNELAHDFIGDFRVSAGCSPLTDRASRFFWSFTSEGDAFANLFSADRGRFAWTRRIFQTLMHTQLAKRYLGKT